MAHLHLVQAGDGFQVHHQPGVFFKNVVLQGSQQVAASGHGQGAGLLHGGGSLLQGKSVQMVESSHSMPPISHLPRAFSTRSGVAGGSTQTPVALWMAVMMRWEFARLWLMPLAP